MNSIGSWTTFQSSTTDEKIALWFSFQNQKPFSGELLLFKIYLTSKNDPPTFIELAGKDFSYYEAEKEVLILPMFTF